MNLNKEKSQSILVNQRHESRNLFRSMAGPMVSPMLNNILIVDDDDDFLHFIAIMVNVHYPNIVVRMARDGSEALDIIGKGILPAIVITDIAMPRLDGNALCRALRETHGNDVKIIAMTGTRQSIDAEVDAILSKPFSIDALFVAIDQALGVQQ